MSVVTECRTGVLDLAVSFDLKELEEDVLSVHWLVIRAIELKSRQKAVIAWLAWQVAHRRRCALLLPRRRNADVWVRLLADVLPHIKVIIWTPDVEWPKPREYDVLICSYRKFWNHLVHSSTCGFHAVVAYDLHWMFCDKDSYLVEALLFRLCDKADHLKLCCLVAPDGKSLKQWLDLRRKRASEKEAIYVALDKPRVQATYPKYEDEKEDVAEIVARQPSVPVVFVPAPERREQESLFKAFQIPVRIKSYEFGGVAEKVQCAVVYDIDLTESRLAAVCDQLQKGGNLVILCRNRDKRELVQLVNHVTGDSGIVEPSLDIESYLLQTLRNSRPLSQAYRLGSQTFYALKGDAQVVSVKELWKVFQKLVQEGLVRRHGNAKGQLGGTAGVTPLGRRLAASIYNVAEFRESRKELGPGKPDPEAIFRVAARLAKQPEMESFLQNLWEGRSMPQPESPQAVRSALYTVSLIDEKTAHLLEERVQAQGWQLPPSTLRRATTSKMRRRIRLQEVIAYMHRALIGGRLEAGGKRVGSRRALHYRDVAANLKVSPFGAYRIFRDYFGEEEPDWTLQGVSKSEYDKTRQQLQSIRQYTRLIYYRKGWHRPIQLLVRGNLRLGELVLPEQFTKTCGECTFLERQPGLCALWHWVGKDYPELKKRPAQVSRSLHGCWHFTSRTDFAVTQLASTTIIDGDSLRPLTRWICARSGCDGILDCPPKVGFIARCTVCGTEHRKLPRGPLRVHIGFLDLLRNEVRAITGDVPEGLAQDLPSHCLSLFLGPDDHILEVTKSQIKVQYAGSRVEESYEIITIEHVTLTPESAPPIIQATLRRAGIHLTIRTRPSVPPQPSPKIAEALRMGRESAELFLRHCCAQYLSLLHATASLHSTGEVDHDDICCLLWEQLDHLQLHSKHITQESCPRTRLRACEAQMTKELVGVLRYQVAQHSLNEVKAIGRRRGRRVPHWSRFPIGVARGWTPLDAALNLANRLLRQQLRTINANLGLGWNTQSLFLHQPQDHPGLGVHLDLEEVPRLFLNVLVTIAFCTSNITLDDFNTDYTSSRLPFYTPTIRAYAKLLQLVETVLEQPTKYQGKLLSLRDAHSQHVRHLIDILLSQKYDRYEPLIWSPPNCQDFWKQYMPLEQFLKHIHQRIQGPLRQLIHEMLFNLGGIS